MRALGRGESVAAAVAGSSPHAHVDDNGLLAANYLALVQLASIRLRLAARNESTL
jgi:hypothetical protein